MTVRGDGQCNSQHVEYANGSHMVPTLDGIFPNSFAPNEKQDTLMCPEESNELNSNSLHEFA